MRTPREEQAAEQGSSQPGVSNFDTNNKKLTLDSKVKTLGTMLHNHSRKVTGVGKQADGGTELSTNSNHKKVNVDINSKDNGAGNSTRFIPLGSTFPAMLNPKSQKPIHEAPSSVNSADFIPIILDYSEIPAPNPDYLETDWPILHGHDSVTDRDCMTWPPVITPAAKTWYKETVTVIYHYICEQVYADIPGWDKGEVIGYGNGEVKKGLNPGYPLRDLLNKLRDSNYLNKNEKDAIRLYTRAYCKAIGDGRSGKIEIDAEYLVQMSLDEIVTDLKHIFERPIKDVQTDGAFGMEKLIIHFKEKEDKAYYKAEAARIRAENGALSPQERAMGPKTFERNLSKLILGIANPDYKNHQARLFLSYDMQSKYPHGRTHISSTGMVRATDGFAAFKGGEGMVDGKIGKLPHGTHNPESNMTEHRQEDATMETNAASNTQKNGGRNKSGKQSKRLDKSRRK